MVGEREGGWDGGWWCGWVQGREQWCERGRRSEGRADGRRGHAHRRLGILLSTPRSPSCSSPAACTPCLHDQASPALRSQRAAACGANNLQQLQVPCAPLQHASPPLQHAALRCNTLRCTMLRRNMLRCADALQSGCALPQLPRSCHGPSCMNVASCRWIELAWRKFSIASAYLKKNKRDKQTSTHTNQQTNKPRAAAGEGPERDRAAGPERGAGTSSGTCSTAPCCARSPNRPCLPPQKAALTPR
jgi:hypothetical protein